MKQAVKNGYHRVTKMISLTIATFKDPFYDGVASQIAYSLFLSIVPTLILLTQLLGMFSVSLSGLREWISENLTGEAAYTLTSMLRSSHSSINSIFLAVVALWGASRAQYALLRITNYTITDGKSRGQGFVLDRLRAIRTILITIFTIAFALIVLVYGNFLIKLVFGSVVGEAILSKAWLLIKWPITLALYFLMVSNNYYVLPTEKLKYRDIIPGSLFASIGFMVVTFCYYQYTIKSTNYDLLYGSFSSVVMLLVWFWLLAWVMCLGVCFNRVWWATRKENCIPIGEASKDHRKPMNIQ